LFLIQSTHHQLPRHQAASPHSLRFMRYTTPTETTPSTCTWATCRQWVNGKNIDFEEWFVWREIYFSHGRTTFTAWLLVDSHSSPPHTHPDHHHVPPKKVVKAKGLISFFCPAVPAGTAGAHQYRAACCFSLQHGPFACAHEEHKKSPPTWALDTQS
jgi:hypothetical protein